MCMIMMVSDMSVAHTHTFLSNWLYRSVNVRSQGHVMVLAYLHMRATIF